MNRLIGLALTLVTLSASALEYPEDIEFWRSFDHSATLTSVASSDAGNKVVSFFSDAKNPPWNDITQYREGGSIDSTRVTVINHENELLIEQWAIARTDTPSSAHGSAYSESQLRFQISLPERYEVAVLEYTHTFSYYVSVYSESFANVALDSRFHAWIDGEHQQLHNVVTVGTPFESGSFAAGTFELNYYVAVHQTTDFVLDQTAFSYATANGKEGQQARAQLSSLGEHWRVTYLHSLSDTTGLSLLSGPGIPPVAIEGYEPATFSVVPTLISTITPVPEPTSWLLAMSGVLLLAVKTSGRRHWPHRTTRNISQQAQDCRRS